MPLEIHPDDRVAVFIDGVNLYSSLRTQGMNIDYRGFEKRMRTETRLAYMNYYTTLRQDLPTIEGLYRLLDVLEFNGYRVRTKDARVSMEPNGTSMRQRGTTNTELAIEMTEAAKKCHHIILFSGDSEFAAAVETAQGHGCRVTVVSTRKQNIVSEDLRRVADHFIDFCEVQEDFFIDEKGDSDQNQTFD